MKRINEIFTDYDLDEVIPVPGTNVVYKPHQGVTQFHGDKLAKDLRFSAAFKDRQ